MPENYLYQYVSGQESLAFFSFLQSRSGVYHLTEALKNGAGHIGYSILKDVRGKGYGTAGLKLTLEKARKIVSENEIYLRVNKDNIASQKVMLNNGTYFSGEDEKHLFLRIPK